MAALGRLGMSSHLVEFALVYWGDFNATRFPSEMKGAARITPEMMDFSKFISQVFLDLSLEGGTFTWSNNHDPPSMSRIDRFVVFSNWETHFPNLCQRLLQHPLSNHFPILLDSNDINRGKCSFKFEKMWLQRRPL